MYEQKYLKYKQKYIELKNIAGGNKNYDYYKYFTRSGIIPYFNRYKGDNQETYLILTKSVIGGKTYVSDFGGLRDDFDMSPEKNALREFIEESTYLDDPNDNTKFDDKKYVVENNILGKYISHIEDKLNNKEYTVLFNGIQNKNVYNYLYYINVGEIEVLRWSGRNIRLTFDDIQYVDVYRNNYKNEISQIIIIKYSNINKIKGEFRYLIYDTIRKNSRLLHYVKKMDFFIKNDTEESKKKT